ncbi:glutamine synthetase, type I [Beggiatoa sp. PS]|nr:glutamine synthetase, type I [Beggiatoa sp. PS]
MSAENVLNMMKENEVKFVDLRFTDTKGKEQHVTIQGDIIDDDFFEEGKMFDGSSIAGWKGINESDMILMPETDTAVLDPFSDEVTLNLRCDVIEPTTMQGYERDPRSLAKRGENYLKSTGIGDTAYFGPENEFFIFDDVRWGSDIRGSFYKVDSQEAGWNSEKVYSDGNLGHRPGLKGGYFPVPPVDSQHDLRSAMCLTLDEMGVKPEVHHHEVATAGQGEIGVLFNTLVKKADEVQILKYVIMNVAHGYGKTATFMPKPLVGDNGNGMHVHQSISKEGNNVFAGDKYANLSESALYYIGGILKHARAINAFANASPIVTNVSCPVLKHQSC